tara:strand:+ start:4688 stop:7462 length:2775 start_codon:yes stop_codon:yes gene_type:complete
MAIPSQEVEILKEGVDNRAPANSSFALNLIHRRGAFEVRDGFGQLAQRTTSLNMPMPFNKDFGINEHVASTVMNTNFGHVQIVSLFKASVNTANTTSNTPNTIAWYNNFRESLYSIHIDDITDGTHWEEILYTHTAQSQTVRSASQVVEEQFASNMGSWYGHYETGSDKDRQSVIKSQSDEPVFFHEYADVLLFGSKDIGTWIYYPTHYRHSLVPRSAQADTSATVEAIGKYSESSRIQRLSFTPGLGEGFPYASNSTLPNFVDATSIGASVVYASDRRLYFTDASLPASIIVDNVVDVPCDKEITAIEEQLGNIIVFTESETFVYRPAGNTAIKSGGMFTQLSNSTGCVNSSSVIKVDGTIFWISKNGIFATSGNFQINPIGEPVERFFTDYVTNPLSSYYPKSGMINNANTQPQTTLQASLKGSNISYCERFACLVATFPENNASLVFSGGKWSVWTYESIAFYNQSTSTEEVGVTQNVTMPWIVGTPTTMFMVGSVDPQTINDVSSENRDILTNSYYLMEYGRGGALDRSVDDEDYRQPAGSFEYNTTVAAAATANTFLYYGKPFRLRSGYKFRGTEPVLTDSDEVYLVPVYAILPTAFDRIAFWTSEISFDNTNWDAILYDNTASGDPKAIDFILPNERIFVEAGYGYGGIVALKRVVVAGSSIEISFDQAAATTINATPNRATPLLFLPFKKKNTTSSVYSMGISPNTTALKHRFVDATASTYKPVVFVWDQMFIGTNDKRFENSVVQPVDWAYKSAALGMGDPDRFLARGLYSVLLSRGPGNSSDYAVQFTPGLYNTVLSSDRKGWMSQIIDFSGANADAIERIENKSSIRTRVKSGTNLVTKTFGSNLTYGASGNTTAGNYLIDDEEVSTIATSDSVRGECFSYMLYGHIQIRSQKIKLQSVKASYRVAGGRRRFGH